jgi:hypothetical protein
MSVGTPLDSLHVHQLQSLMINSVACHSYMIDSVCVYACTHALACDAEIDGWH